MRPARAAVLEPRCGALQHCRPASAASRSEYKWTTPAAGCRSSTRSEARTAGGTDHALLLGEYTSGSAVTPDGSQARTSAPSTTTTRASLRQPRDLLGDCHDRLLHRREPGAANSRRAGRHHAQLGRAPRDRRTMNLASATTITGDRSPDLRDELRRVAGDGRVDRARSWRRTRWRLDLVLVDGAEQRRALVHAVVDLGLRRRQLHTCTGRLHGASLGSLSEVGLRRLRRASPSSATSGTTYIIGAGGICGYDNGVYWGDMGTFTLNWVGATGGSETFIDSTSRGKHVVSLSLQRSRRSVDRRQRHLTSRAGRRLVRALHGPDDVLGHHRRSPQVSCPGRRLRAGTSMPRPHQRPSAPNGSPKTTG